ncbi:hypothetical protein BJ508DRAFT_339311 [Ascobolus immersus RN42]|uniref:Uncharacterized protein n=1 Tax=Ascobolus immersus RN42 TaxID=1160509 RepID=A0A3N4HML0_ASCIM|nr:hypothetical protein BJ508DRAFT_339311 [Ascobolus immersus RN42]
MGDPQLPGIEACKVNALPRYPAPGRTCFGSSKSLSMSRMVATLSTFLCCNENVLKMAPLVGFCDKAVLVVKHGHFCELKGRRAPWIKQRQIGNVYGQFARSQKHQLSDKLHKLDGIRIFHHPRIFREAYFYHIISPLTVNQAEQSHVVFSPSHKLDPSISATVHTLPPLNPLTWSASETSELHSTILPGLDRLLYSMIKPTDNPSLTAKVAEETTPMEILTSIIDGSTSWTSDHDSVFTFDLEDERWYPPIVKIASRENHVDCLEADDLVFKVGRSYMLMHGGRCYCLLLGVEGEEEKVRKMLMDYDLMEDPIVMIGSRNVGLLSQMNYGNTESLVELAE